VQFDRIRLSGFKSFVDPTELHIEGGLTGVVGPNGCGKSNLLEAIRWVMGENSPKSMRGSGMDDVIFSGTERRPARNLAEVTLMLDNSSRKAPAEFNDSDLLEVSRRIERESGSAYRINGRDVRAKDVQLLFADAATGAHSPALVSQGQISALISAKPKDRRAILEEAAGITGLYTRRKDAESRLRGAENNIIRLHDVMQQMEAQIGSLKRQARQARRYRNISGDLNRAEATLMYIRWKSACEALITAERQHLEAEKNVAEITGQVSRLTTEHAGLAERLPKLRQAEAEAAAALQRITLARDGLTQEKKRLESQQVEVQNQLDQIEHDKVREMEMLSDADNAIKTLDEEATLITTQKAADNAGEAEAAAKLETAHDEASKGEQKLDELSAELAGTRARAESLQSDLEMLERRNARLNEEASNTKAELAELTLGDEQLKAVVEAEGALKKSEENLEALQNQLQKAEENRLKIQEARDKAREEANDAKSKYSAVQSEIKLLEDLISSANTSGEAPVSDIIKVKSGFETALGAALGDDLDAPLSETSAIGWRDLGALDNASDLPDGVRPLSEFITGGNALSRRLSQIGVVSEADGKQLAKDLKAGQRLVSAEGSLWRWDGFHRTADVKSAAAIRLSQKNRLEELKQVRKNVAEIVAKTDRELMEQERGVDAAHSSERDLRAKRGEGERALGQARRNVGEKEKAASERTKRLAALTERTSRIDNELKETKEQLIIAQQHQKDISSNDDGEKKLFSLRDKVEQLRAALANARAEFDSRHRIQTERSERLVKISEDKEAWVGRRVKAASQQGELLSRTKSLSEKLAVLSLAPKDIEEKRIKLINQIDKSDFERKTAADALAIGENSANEKEQDLKAKQAELAALRETRVRFESSKENATQRRQEMAGQIAERFRCPPATVLDKAEVTDQDNLPELHDIERRLDKLKIEREKLGAVNLRADVELQEIIEQLEHLEGEKTDLEAAIGRLRQGINSLNREGRERMLVAFETVNKYFGELFVTLFGGGSAYLELVDSDDPLDAGLEIMASPPGKKLQSLSLLSGGEQALTATSLIFAVFMTNPAPICVLDEVDAPLDDANVERFCGLLDNIVSKTKTRFLIVTHNAVTMSRMDRLFGVTMSERGVSQLVSVDLQMAERLQAVG
jgi:chromosome segregation protein